MYTYSKDGKVRQLRGESSSNNEKPCSRQTVKYEKPKNSYRWMKWVLLFFIILLGVYLLCTNMKKSKRMKYMK